MAGLLDGIFNSEQGRMGLGLLAAGSARGDGAGFGQRLSEAVGSVDQWKQQQAQAKRMKMQEEYQAFQMQQAMAQAKAQEVAQDAAKRQQAGIPGLFRATQTQGQVSIPQLGDVDMFSQGAKVEAPSMRGPTGFDVQGALALGLTPDQIEKYAGLNNIGKQEAKDWQDIEGPNGAKIRQAFDKFGQPIGSGVNGYVAPVSVSQGDRTTFVKPAAGVSLPMGMSFADRNAAGNLDISRQRLAMEKNKLASETANGGYSVKPLPASALKMQGDAVDAVNAAGTINDSLTKIETQIESGKLKFGPVSNLVNSAMNVSGMSSEESRNFSSFKSNLERMRNESLRLNTGVQTDGDAQRAWNELFQSINDTNLVKQRLQEIRAINERGAELQKLKVDSIRSNYNAAPMDFKPLESAKPTTGKAPMRGQVVDGFKFKGGNPADQANWEKQ